MKTSKEYKRMALDGLKNNWGMAIIVLIAVSVIESVLSATMIGSVLTFVLAGPIAVGLIVFFLNIIRKEKVEFKNIFEIVSKDISSVITTYLLQLLYTFLWSLLFIVPGIIKSYSYALTMYIKSQDANIKNNEAITLSRQIMNGKKLKLFCLQLSFIGWFILSVLTFGIGFIFLAPYFEATVVAFYQDAYSEYALENGIKIEVNNEFETEEINEENNEEIIIEE